MFKKNKPEALEINEQKISTIIGEDFIFRGEIKGSSVIRIEGTIVGNINVEAGVVLGEKANVEGNINTRSAIIYGKVNGHVTTSHLEIKKTGMVSGDITTDTLEIELGAHYNGKLDMKRKEVLAEAS